MSVPEPAGWTEIRRRLEAAGAAIGQQAAPAHEEEERILRDRARELAREPEQAAAVAETLEVVEFALASERYAFPLAQVRTVSQLADLTPVPGTPAFILGIINLRGEIRTVIDLRKFFELPGAGITELNRIILIQHQEMELGILADAISGLRRIPLHDLQPALPTLTDLRADYLRGLTRDRLVVLDAVRIITDPRILLEDRYEA